MTLIESAINLRNEEKFDQAKKIILPLIEKEPLNSENYYQMGWIYDASDNPTEAIPFYYKALELGLKKDKDGCYLALGSSLRATGRYQESVKVLKIGIKEFPSNHALQVFYAMSLYNIKNFKESTSLLLRLVTKNTNDEGIISYESAITEYSEDLDKIW